MKKSTIALRPLKQMTNKVMKSIAIPSTQIAAILLLAVVLPSCQINEKPDTSEIQENIVYFKDPNTGLCFAAVNSTNTKSWSNSSSITCVPCDSLKKVEVK